MSAPALRVGFVPGVTVTKWTRIWAERHPRMPLDVAAVEQPDQRSVLDTGERDLCFARLPIDRTGLHLVPLYDEVPVLVVPKGHPASVLDEVGLDELDDEEWVPAGASSHDHDRAFDLVAAGAGLLVVPHAIARSHSRRDLRAVAIRDGVPTRVALAWLVERDDDLIQEFVGVVRGRTANSTRSPSSTQGQSTPARPADEKRRSGGRRGGRLRS